MSAEPIGNRFVLQVRNLSKAFPGVQALQGVGLDVAKGSVHALVGENGAGKSTLVKTLAGLYRPDAGEILLHGRPVQFKSPHAALQRGIAMIHQELMPFPDLTVAENIFMGQEPASRFPGWIDQKRLYREAGSLLDRLGAALPPTRRLRELSVAEMQTVEIAKAMAHNAEVIIMDEPTSAISEREVAALFQIIADLKRQGVAVIYISHKLDEVFHIADAVTVLRDGRHIATHKVGDLDETTLIALMVGRELSAAFSKSGAARGEVALAVSGLTQAGKFHDVHLEVRRGEILGLAGLMGAGRTELVSALYGLAPAEAGEICVHGRHARIGSPKDALANGIALVSEDRQAYGLVPSMSVKHNLTLSNLRRCCRGWFIDPRAENQVADERIRALAIKTPNRNQTVTYLSGGNQQKVVIAKALLTEPQVLLLDEPTRGIDIGAKAEVYALISRLAHAGKAILLVSSELPEILALSDRLLVMCQGKITAELDPRRTTQAEVLKYAMPT